MTPLDMALNEWNHEMTKTLCRLNGMYGLYRVHVKDSNSSEKAISNLENFNKIIGVKIHPSFDGESVLNSKWNELFAYLNKNRRIVLIHCGRSMSVAHYSYALKRAEENPDLTFILAHMGGNDLKRSKTAVREATCLSNVYFDTSNCRTPYVIEYAVAKIGQERLLFGSDYPWGSCYSNAYTIIDSMISEDAKISILGSNLKELFKVLK